MDMMNEEVEQADSSESDQHENKSGHKNILEN